MANTGLTIAGAGANNADAGNAAWAPAGNVTADDDAAAEAAVKAGETSQYLHATGFGFSIPDGATIDGIVARVQRAALGVSGTVVQDHTIQLIVGGSRSGDNKADTGTDWPPEYADTDYGADNDTWGLSLSASDVNASNFGVAVRNAATGGVFAGVLVDAIWIDVHYTVDGESAIAPAAAHSYRMRRV